MTGPDARPTQLFRIGKEESSRDDARPPAGPAADDRVRLVTDKLREGRSYVTPGGLKYWPALDAFRSLMDEKNAALARHAQTVEALEQLIAWDARWPDNHVHSAALFTLCHKELDACVDIARAALAAHTDSRAPEARLDPRRFSARYSDRVAKIEGGLPMERG